MSAAVFHTETNSFHPLSVVNEDTFVEIYREYWPKLFTIAFNRLSSRQGAEDVVQEVMISLWKRRNEVVINNLENWLAAATRYAVFRQMARYGPQRIAPIQDTEASYDGDFDYRQMDKIIRENIHRLPPKCKIVFEFSRQYGLTNKQIAGKLSISEKSVEKHITKAIHNLRKKLGRSLRHFFL